MCWQKRPVQHWYFSPHPTVARAVASRLHWENSLHQYPPLPIFEVDAVHNGGLVNALEIFHLPALFLYVDGHYHRELQSEALPARIHHAIQTALSLPAEDEP